MIAFSWFVDDSASGIITSCAAVLIAVGAIWKITYSAIRWGQRLEAVMAKVETQTNGQLAAQFAVVARKQDEIVERLESTESRVAVIAAHVDVLVATATPKPIRPSRAKKES